LDNSSIYPVSKGQAHVSTGGIPTYALYGEADGSAAADWAHCETIQARSRLHNYRIEPHRHEKLFQILHLTGGAADVLVDGQSRNLTGPSVVTMPPMAVHGYTFSPDVTGSVLTLFESRLTQVMPAMDGMRDLLRTARIIPLHDQDEAAGTLAADLAALSAEFANHRPGQSEALQARVLLIFITLHRLLSSRPEAGSGAGQRAHLHALRFRELVDKEFRTHRPIAFYASRLGLTSPHLNRICRDQLGDTALGVVHQRLLLEAKRYLTFTALSAKEIALLLGFEDPAYFARFFKHKTGLPPLAFRARQQNAIA